MSKKRTSKVKNIILFLVIIAFLIAIIGGTYSRYVSTGTANTSAGIAKWSIKVGEADISSETFEISAVDSTVNGNVKQGTIAPGKDLVATLEVNPAGTEVAIDYNLSIGELQLGENFNNNSIIGITKVTATVEGEDPINLAKTNGNYVFFESLEDVLLNKKVTFNAYIGWEEQGTTAGDTADTANVAQLTEITAPITITAKQHIGTVVEVNQSMNLENSTGNLNVGDKLVLTENITYDYEQYPTSSHKRVEFPINTTFDLNGKTVTSPNGSLAYVGDNFTIKNGEFVGLISQHEGRYGIQIWDENNTHDISKGVVIENVTTTGICLYNAEVTLKNVTSTVPDDAKYYSVYGNVYSKITIESGTYTAGSKTTALLGYCVNDSTEAGKATPDGKNPTNGFVIKGGTFITNNKPLYHDNSSHVAPVIQGGSFDIDVSTLIDSNTYQCTLNSTTGLYDVTLK